MNGALPPGFTVDRAAPQPVADLPPGFTLDALPPGFTVDQPAPDTSVAQNVGVAARAAYPYATAAGLGAVAGAPFGGPVGSAFGAGLGTLGLGISDLATMGYNVVTPLFGGNRVPLPSENIQALYERLGFGRRPQTPEQELLSAGVSGATSGVSQAGAFNVLARQLGPTVTRNVMSTLGQQPAVQTGAGAGGAALPTALREYADVDDPYALMASSLAGAVLGGKAVSGTGNVARAAGETARMATTPTLAEMRGQAKRAYRQAEDAGVQYEPTAVVQFGDDLAAKLRRARFDPDLHPNAAVALRRIQEAGRPAAPNAAATPVTFEDLDILRGLTRAARLSVNADERRIGRMIVSELDNFALRPPSNAVAAGDEKAAGAAIQEARSLWARMSKSSEIEDAVERARLSSQGSDGRMDEALRAQFASLARDIQKGRAPGFTAEEAANIEAIAKNETQRFGTRLLSPLAPSLTRRGAASVLAQTGGMTAATGDPTMAAFAIPSMAVGAGARAGRNALAELEAARLSAGMRRGDVRAPLAARPVNLMSPTIQQMLLQSE